MLSLFPPFSFRFQSPNPYTLATRNNVEAFHSFRVLFWFDTTRNGHGLDKYVRFVPGEHFFLRGVRDTGFAPQIPCREHGFVWLGVRVWSVRPLRRAGTAEKRVVAHVFRHVFGRVHELRFHLYNLSHSRVLRHVSQVMELGCCIVGNHQGLDVAHVQIGRVLVVNECALHFSRILQFLGMGQELVGYFCRPFQEHSGDGFHVVSPCGDFCGLPAYPAR